MLPTVGVGSGGLGGRGGEVGGENVLSPAFLILASFSWLLFTTLLMLRRRSSFVRFVTLLMLRRRILLYAL